MHLFDRAIGIGDITNHVSNTKSISKAKEDHVLDDKLPKERARSQVSVVKEKVSRHHDISVHNCEVCCRRILLLIST
jgi:hypothetical protein